MSARPSRVRESTGSKFARVFPADEFQRVAKLSYGTRESGNAIVNGENLEVLQQLRSVYEGQVRCVYIDPPYNNREQYTHYSDDLDHAHWQRDIRVRLEALAPFLRPDGSIWISIDDRELHYLKVIADTVFGRANFVATIVWQHRTTRENRRVFSNNHEYVLVYAKDIRKFTSSRNRLPASAEVFKRYKNPDNDPRGSWQSISANVQDGHATASQFYTVKAPNGRLHRPPKGRCWVYNEERMQEAIAQGDIWFGRDGNGVPRLKSFLKDSATGLTPPTLWTAEDVGTTLAAKKHLLQIFPDAQVFDTPKPESLIRRILEIASDPGDLVLDAYLGSGTTAAAAHKIGRCFIGIEIGEHAVTHCVKRLRDVVDGERGGISEEVGWIGGGGFDFYRFRSW